MASSDVQSKKILAGIMGILFGAFGIHKFVLGYVTAGIIQLLLSFCCGIGGVIGLIEGIIYLTKTDDEFEYTYIRNQRPWF